jgi:hypothetical protein
MSTTSPCRLYFYLARNSPVAVILRRGPTKWVQMIKWDTANDTFTEGQWIEARVQEYESSISDDGTLFKSSVHQERLPPKDPDVGSRWDAISRPPFFTALAVHGETGWIDRSLSQNIPPADIKFRDAFGLADGAVEGHHSSWLCIQGYDAHHHQMLLNLKASLLSPQVGTNHLILKGRATVIAAEQALNKRIEQLDQQYSEWLNRPEPETNWVWKKRKPSGEEHLLRKIATEKYKSVITYYVQSASLEQEIIGATCADWDKAGRLVYGAVGKLFSASVNDQGIHDVKQLADFNANKPQNVKAPPWALEW